jgi:hypothetical protein
MPAAERPCVAGPTLGPLMTHGYPDRSDTAPVRVVTLRV